MIYFPQLLSSIRMLVAKLRRGDGLSILLDSEHGLKIINMLSKDTIALLQLLNIDFLFSH
jgi:hypothetical protein